MGILSLDTIRPGMVLANDVKDRNGRILLASGSEITEKHLRIFKMWGILAVPVLGEEREEPPCHAPSEVDPDRLRKAESTVAQLFSLNDLDHPFIKELFRLVTLEHLSSLEDPNHGP